LDYISEIIRDVRTATSTKTPIIVFCKGANHSLSEITTTGCDVVGLDWTIDISDAKGLIGESVALQGNLDPMLLFAPEYVIRSRVEEIAERMGSPVGHIFNLGHGITPDVDPERAKCFVEAAKEAYRNIS
jgi:uroporphyrinogen decarboxylase